MRMSLLEDAVIKDEHVDTDPTLPVLDITKLVDPSRFKSWQKLLNISGVRFNLGTLCE